MQQVEIPPSTYSAEAVCGLLLDSSVTDSTASSEDGDSESSSSEYDLSDPEAGLMIGETEMTVYSARSQRDAGASHKFQSREQGEFDLSDSEASLVRNESNALVDMLTCHEYCDIQCR